MSLFAALTRSVAPWLSKVTLGIGSFILGVALAAPSAGQVTVYCSALADFCEAMAKAFEKETGIRVAMVRKSTGEVFAQVKAESSNPKGDVWWGGTGDPHLQAAEEKLTYAYTSKKLKELREWSVRQAQQSEFRTVGVYAGALGIVYNTPLLKKRGLPAPKCWKDLLDPKFRGEVQMPNPNSSGTAYTMLATMVQLFGEKDGFDYMKKLHVNINQYTKSGAAPVKAASRGETTIGIGWLHDAVPLAQQGFPIEMIAPCEGTGYEVGSMSVVLGAPHLENAIKFYEWALQPTSQNLANTVHAYQIPAHQKAQIPKEAPKFEQIKFIDYNFKKYGSSEERKRLLAKWETEVKHSQ